LPEDLIRRLSDDENKELSEDEIRWSSEDRNKELLEDNKKEISDDYDQKVLGDKWKVESEKLKEENKNKVVIDLISDNFLKWQKIFNTNFLPFSFLSWVKFVFSWIVFESWNVIFFSSKNFSCDFVRQFIVNWEIVEFHSMNFLQKNKFPWEKVCFINLPKYKKKIVFWWFFIDWKRHWIQVPYDKYYKLKLQLYRKFKNK
jgi:hypothetical protein